ncbi:ABC transporter substrate-binding protein [Conexibacter sp. S30A1]|uniref:ABC transporter substrate-binding protein n=1 Tax=Conexibacter sp. S30A1 TaxID=2937800 RepID=UPI00200F2895|nr:ABC transporter substrate-binding protein [Conexibacter sp. S30A1]
MQLVGEWLTLVDYDLTVHPWLAESWVSNHDATVWTFKIRGGVKFNDGTPMTVDDIVYTFKQQADPKIGVNAASIFGGVLTPDGVHKVGDHYVRFALESPVAAWPNLGVSQQNGNVCIVPRGYDWAKFNRELPGTGHFKMVSYSDQLGGKFVRNPHYWGSPAKPAAIVLSYFSDEQAETAALSGGDIDVDDSFSVANSPQLLGGGYNVVSKAASNNNMTSMRCDAGAFRDKLVRQALALTLDRPGIVRAIFKGHAQVGNDSPFAPVYPSTNRDVPQRHQNLSEARKLLAAAGVSRGFKAQMAVVDSLSAPEVAQIYKESAARIGIDLELSVMAASEYYGSATFGQSPWLDTTVSMAYFGRDTVPSTLLDATLMTYDPKTGRGAWNSAHFSNQRCDELAVKLVGTVDLAVQRRLAGQIETLLLDQTPVTVPYFANSLTAMGKGTLGVFPVPGGLFYWNMTKE